MVQLGYIFPGQGSQAIGMGREFYEESIAARRIWDQADEILGIPLRELVWEGATQELNLTINAQPALLTACVAAYEAIKEAGLEGMAYAGHSLGEYSALVAAGAIDFPTALSLVRRRGELMEEAYPKGQGAMAAVLGLDTAVIEEICNGISHVTVANYNCPGQVVISGKRKAVEKAGKALQEQGARRVVFLDVSGPFHSPLMEPAAQAMADELKQVKIQRPSRPVFSNVDGQPVEDGEAIKGTLVAQLTSPVRWEETIHNMVAQGVELFVEVGHGQVLKGLLRRIDRRLQVVNVDTPQELEKLVAQAKGDIVR
ncbi:MAG: ACP S-malonyltransferase [Limnochordia bacterium]|jgi:[acyl-carrier-protein] S-malonyltransferase